MLIIYKDK